MEKLAQYWSTDIADALIELGDIRTHVPDINMLSPTARDVKLIGHAFTVSMVDVQEQPKQILDRHYLDNVPEGSVVVISTPRDSVNAVWGGLLTARAQKLAVKGTIVDGRCRDILEVQDAKYPLFARGFSCYGAAKFTRVSSVNQTINVGNVPVAPGDIVFADLNGVVIIPKYNLDQVLAICEKNAVRDDLCMNAIKQGHTITDTFKRYR